jgi:hypothetical protein
MTSPLRRSRTDGQDAGDRQAEREGVGAQIREAGPLSRFAISPAVRRDVLPVAPGQRGWDAMAIRPLGASRRRNSASRSAGADQNPRELTARMTSNGPSRAGGS